jgi:hypothetical protein
VPARHDMTVLPAESVDQPVQQVAQPVKHDSSHGCGHQVGRGPTPV